MDNVEKEKDQEVEKKRWRRERRSGKRIRRVGRKENV